MNRKSISLKDISITLGFACFCIAVSFETLIETVIGSIGLYALYFLSVVMTLYFISGHKGVHIQKKALNSLMPWIIFALIFVLFYNANLYRASFFATIRWMYFFVYMILISHINPKKYTHLIKVLGIVAGVYVLFVFFFMVFPSQYSVMYNLWGYWPTGTDSGASGYRAGLAAHYSENAMMISMAVFAVVCLFMTESRKQRKIWFFAFFAVSVAALVLTTKRAHLLFGFVAILFAYFVFKPRQRAKRFFIIVIGAAALLAAFYLLSLYVPAVGDIVERFSNMGEDTESSTRFAMWDLAIKCFEDNPVFGIGWNGYKYEFNRVLFDPNVRAERYAYLNAHNVYLQLLAETGVAGFSLFISGAVNIFSKTLKTLNRCVDPRLLSNRAPLVFSVIVQVFFYLYCLTGNCLYDIMFAFLAVAVGFAIGCRFSHSSPRLTSI